MSVLLYSRWVMQIRVCVVRIKHVHFIAVLTGLLGEAYLLNNCWLNAVLFILI